MAVTDLDYAKVTGRLALTVGDTADPDDDPDILWCDEGTVQIEPLQTFTKVAGAADGPFSTGHAVISATIDGDGYVSFLGKRWVHVIDLTSPKVNPQIGANKATHRVTFVNVKAGGTRVDFPSVDLRFTAAGPDGDGVNDLTELMPVLPGASTPIYRGEKGIGILGAAIVDGDQLEIELTDGTLVPAGTLPAGPGGSDAGVAGYIANPTSLTAQELLATTEAIAGPRTVNQARRGARRGAPPLTVAAAAYSPAVTYPQRTTSTITSAHAWTLDPAVSGTGIYAGCVVGGLVSTRWGSISSRSNGVANTDGSQNGQRSALRIVRDFMFDGVKLEYDIANKGAGYYRVQVDDLHVGSTVPVAVASTGQNHLLTLDFTDAGGAKPRRIRIETYNHEVRQIYTGPTDSIWDPTMRGPIVACFGDSYGAGSNMGGSGGLSTFPAVVGEVLGADHVYNFHIGGTGAVTANSATFGGGPKYRDHFVYDITSAGVMPDVIVIGGTHNDPTGGGSQAALQAELQALFTLARATCPDAVIVMAGPFSQGSGHGAYSTHLTTIAAAIAATPGCVDYFIDPITIPWFTGTGRSGATAGDGNSDLYIGTDAIHPTEPNAGFTFDGVRYLGLRVAHELARLMEVEVGTSLATAIPPPTPPVSPDVIALAADPTINDDSGDGYGVGTRWVNTATLAAYTALSVSVGAAVWLRETTDVQVFTASGTWTKPAWAKTCMVCAIGSGGGGGSGARSASGTANSGGAGGGGAGMSLREYAASTLGATETVTIGAVGAGGAAQTSDGSGGTTGGNGAATTFGTHLKANGGGGGGGGQQSASSTAGTGGTGNMSGGNGGAGGSGAVGAGGSSTNAAASGGGAGGGISVGAAAFAGGNSGNTANTGLTNGIGGAAGAGGVSGVSAPVGEPTPAPGGGGGGSHATTPGAGAAGGSYGGGGGGGGSSINGAASGVGGAGAPGIVVVISR